MPSRKKRNPQPAEPQAPVPPTKPKRPQGASRDFLRRQAGWPPIRSKTKE